MNDLSLEALQAEYRRLETALADSTDAATRIEVKDGIVALFRRTEAAVVEIEEFKESIRKLIERFKTLPGPSSPLEKSRRNDHIGASTFIERGWTALAAGDWAQAESLLRDAMALDQESVDAESLLCWSLTHQGRSDEALQRCLKVLVREPEQGMARTAVGVICLHKGISGEAIEHLSRALRTSTDQRSLLYARYWLGVAYLEREMFRDALEALKAAVAKAPNMAEAWAELGRTEWLLGNSEAALEAWHTGASIRHSPFSSRSAKLSTAAQSGGSVPRSPLA